MGKERVQREWRGREQEKVRGTKKNISHMRKLDFFEFTFSSIKGVYLRGEKGPVGVGGYGSMCVVNFKKVQ